MEYNGNTERGVVGFELETPGHFQRIISTFENCSERLAFWMIFPSTQHWAEWVSILNKYVNLLFTGHAL